MNTDLTGTVSDLMDRYGEEAVLTAAANEACSRLARAMREELRLRGALMRAEGVCLALKERLDLAERMKQ